MRISGVVTTDRDRSAETAMCIVCKLILIGSVHGHMSEFLIGPRRMGRMNAKYASFSIAARLEKGKKTREEREPLYSSIVCVVHDIGCNAPDDDRYFVKSLFLRYVTFTWVVILRIGN